MSKQDFWPSLSFFSLLFFLQAINGSYGMLHNLLQNSKAQNLPHIFLSIRKQMTIIDSVVKQANNETSKLH